MKNTKIKFVAIWPKYLMLPLNFDITYNKLLIFKYRSQSVEKVILVYWTPQSLGIVYSMYFSALRMIVQIKINTDH